MVVSDFAKKKWAAEIKKTYFDHSRHLGTWIDVLPSHFNLLCVVCSCASLFKTPHLARMEALEKAMQLHSNVTEKITASTVPRSFSDIMALFEECGGVVDADQSTFRRNELLELVHCSHFKPKVHHGALGIRGPHQSRSRGPDQSLRISSRTIRRRQGAIPQPPPRPLGAAATAPESAAAGPPQARRLSRRKRHHCTPFGNRSRVLAGGLSRRVVFAKNHWFYSVFHLSRRALAGGCFWGLNNA